VSDKMSVIFGMRGRHWTLWLVQTTAGVLCILMALAKDSLGLTICFMIFFSICVQASEGACYGIVPFLTRRALGVASGYIGAGGNAGSTICTALFFTSASIETTDGIVYMGFAIISSTALSSPCTFPCGAPCSSPATPPYPRRTTTSSAISPRRRSRRDSQPRCRSSATTRIRRAPRHRDGGVKV
jgi:NNP family nitrate/nitrite transporter-like MFS transporter